MRENPNPYIAADKQHFKGENTNRITGETISMLKQEGFVWETVEKRNAEVYF